MTVESKKILRLYSDGASQPNPGPMGIGMYIPTFNYAESIYLDLSGSNDEAELFGIYNNYILLDRYSAFQEFDKFVFLTDCRASLSFVKKTEEDCVRNEIWSIVCKIKERQEYYELQGKEICYRFVNRGANNIADALSKRALKTQKIFNNNTVYDLENA
jgi:ribonuclease HI